MNLSELANKLELSVGTVSRVLAGLAEKSRISEKTSERVLAAAKKYGVVVDPVGSSLRTGKLGIVGLLVPDITNPFFAELARSIELRLREHGMALMLSDSNEDAATELEMIRMMKGRRLDGMILAPVGHASKELEEIVIADGFRLVVIDRVLPELVGRVSTVSLDNYQAGRLAAERLLEAGHERIGCLRGSGESHADAERLRGVTEALAKRNVEPRVCGEGYSAEAGLEAAAELLDEDPPSAVITLTGQGVLGLLRVAQEKNIRVPEDLSLVGFDEQPWASFLAAPLTTVVQPVEEMAARAVKLLLGNGNVASECLPALLMERASVKVCNEPAPPK